MPGTEIIQRELHSVLLEELQRRAGMRQPDRLQGLFRDFYAQTRRREPGGSGRVQHHPGQPTILQKLGCDVHAERHRAAPRCGLPASPLQQLPGELLQQSGVLRQGNEDRRADAALLGIVPAREHFEAGDRAAFDADDGLEHGIHLAALNGAAKPQC
ncbi:hypothetical protein Acidovoranil_24430 [Acidovorax sp. FG27]